MIVIREIIEADCSLISVAFDRQGWQKPVAQYQNYWLESQQGRRTVLVAEYDDEFAGYVTIVWQSDYPPFKIAQIPEIVDFNVLIKFQRCGIGTALMDEAEHRIAERFDTVGIGVGLMADYGRAQILYAKRGYVPDGRGIFGYGRWLTYGDQLTVDDNVALYFTKNLQKDRRLYGK
jgi:GNAT superfamily N-acetyltransferase